MAHKTFISYKYSETQDLRDKIIDALGEDASYYKGETSDSPDLTDTSTENIKKNLRDMMYDTSVTIVIISPNMKQSKWIDWEIEYCLKNNTRKDRTSHTNGVVGVIMKQNGGYSWFKSSRKNSDGCSSTTYEETKVYDIINNNRFNQNPKQYCCNVCKTVNALTGSYIAYVEEDDFLNNPEKYINNAYDKSENDAYGYPKPSTYFPFWGESGSCVCFDSDFGVATGAETGVVVGAITEVSIDVSGMQLSSWYAVLTSDMFLSKTAGCNRTSFAKIAIRISNFTFLISFFHLLAQKSSPTAIRRYLRSNCWACPQFPFQILPPIGTLQ